jgi:hypothetical protein
VLGSGGIAEEHPFNLSRKGPLVFQKTISLIIADLCEEERPGGIAEDRAQHVQEAGVDASLGMSLAIPEKLSK